VFRKDYEAAKVIMDRVELLERSIDNWENAVKYSNPKLEKLKMKEIEKWKKQVMMLIEELDEI
jgi:hypothetical protein